MENPFADYGSIVYGERFIGREAEIKAVQDRIFGTAYGNLAIQGLPRIGKSSLAWKAIIEYKNELEKRKIIPVLINVGKIDNSPIFFHKMIKELHLELIKRKIEGFQEFYNQISNENNNYESKDLIENYLENLKEKGFRVMYIFDEFDSVRKFFETTDFQFLRGLSYSPKTKICIVTISRRMLSEIEKKGGGGSNFHQTFNDIYLGMYNDVDLSIYWKKFFNSRVPINDEGKQKIYEFAGRHPFLLDLFNYHLYNNLTENLIDAIQITREKLKLTILNNYKTIFDLLEEENLGTKLLQMVVGPVYDITTTEAEKIERYNLVLKAKSGFKGFSVDFDNYLNLVKREVPILNLWSETETKLRTIVHKWLVERFGENWVVKFRKLQNKEAFIANLEATQEREKKSFPETYSQNLLDFTYPADLFDKFMQVEWKWFKSIFGKEAVDWKQKFDVLAKVRNPLAHNKENILKEFERDETKAYCTEIIQKIDNWTESNKV